MMMPAFPGLTEGLDKWWIRMADFEGWWSWGFFLFWAFLFGGCMGSFLNVCVLRIPRGESLLDRPSHCPVCDHPIRWYDNLPILGYLNLRGRCRDCGTRISPRYLLMELFCALLFAAILLKAGWSAQPPAVLALYYPMASLAVTTFLIDLRWRIIPDATTIPAMALGVIFAAALPAANGLTCWYLSGLYALVSLALTGGALAIFALVGRLIAKQEVFGWGDVKFMMAAAALLGLPGAVFTLLVASLAGSAYGIALACRRSGRRRSLHIPFGPFLAGAAMLWIFAGEKCLRFYFSLLPGPGGH